jgi:hypothetical protein
VWYSFFVLEREPDNNRNAVLNTFPGVVVSRQWHSTIRKSVFFMRLIIKHPYPKLHPFQQKIYDEVTKNPDQRTMINMPRRPGKGILIKALQQALEEKEK